MRNPQLIIAAVCAVSFMGTQAAFAQPEIGRAGRGRSAARMYDPKTVETVSGEVVSVQQIPGRRRAAAGGIHLTLKTDKETVSVHVGPSWYLTEQNLRFAAKDRVEVRGSRVTVDGTPAIIAATVTTGDRTVKLREDDGRPLWRRQRKRP